MARSIEKQGGEYEAKEDCCSKIGGGRKSSDEEVKETNDMAGMVAFIDEVADGSKATSGGERREGKSNASWVSETMVVSSKKNIVKPIDGSCSAEEDSMLMKLPRKVNDESRVVSSGVPSLTPGFVKSLSGSKGSRPSINIEVVLEGAQVGGYADGLGGVLNNKEVSIHARSDAVCSQGSLLLRCCWSGWVLSCSILLMQDRMQCVARLHISVLLEEEVVSLRRELSIKDQIDVERPPKEKSPSKSDSHRAAAPKLAEKPSVQQTQVMSRPLSAPIIPGPRPSALVVSIVQTSPLLAHSVSATGRLGPDPSPSTHSYVPPQLYRNAIMGTLAIASSTGFAQPYFSSSSQLYTQPPNLVSAPMFLP
ncbi:hypothetical protein LOK49_LG08G02781 [Camellia lanceoleosa]|uniref:Uncharacterized protein n=1 Tax=Camellia lanceoleosa TaxID=1840588 RepID=A0ACC0GYR4_9ERIC|nr:hypothetical protein LOK49_LG08G02781 [Camellia lanceoleosa]